MSISICSAAAGVTGSFRTLSLQKTEKPDGRSNLDKLLDLNPPAPDMFKTQQHLHHQNLRTIDEAMKPLWTFMILSMIFTTVLLVAFAFLPLKF